MQTSSNSQLPSEMYSRRRFERLSLPEEAIALDQAGHHLGRVCQVSGGGFLIYPALAVARMPVGQRMTITVVEPPSNTSNSVNVEVRYHNRGAVGVSFVGDTHYA
jgi:PilZ domain